MDIILKHWLISVPRTGPCEFLCELNPRGTEKWLRWCEGGLDSRCVIKSVSTDSCTVLLSTYMGHVVRLINQILLHKLTSRGRKDKTMWQPLHCLVFTYSCLFKSLHEPECVLSCVFTLQRLQSIRATVFISAYLCLKTSISQHFIVVFEKKAACQKLYVTDVILRSYSYPSIHCRSLWSRAMPIPLSRHLLWGTLEIMNQLCSHTSSLLRDCVCWPVFGLILRELSCCIIF